MPIHNLGYREWDGQTESSSTRWMVVTGIGIRRAWQSMWLRRMVFVAWIPALMYGGLIFFYEQSMEGDSFIPRHVFLDLLRFTLPSATGQDVASTFGMTGLSKLVSQMTAERHLFWSSVMLQLQRSQGVALVIMVGLVAPALISQDMRSRAFLLYFSRPLSRTQYILGKAGTLVFFLTLICTLPELLLYVVGVLLSPDASIIFKTWDIPLRIVVASASMVVPSTAVALMLSSMTTETRWATFAWFAIWIFGATAAAAAAISGGDPESLLVRLSFPLFIFNDVSTRVLKIPEMNGHFETQLAVLLTVTLVSVAVVYRRVSAPLES
ncbi:MAG: hypothetical protein R3C19_21925 [Planctomycetaceae bacterium]